MTPEQKAQEYAQKLWDDGFFMTKDILSDAHLAGQQSALEWIPVTERLPETRVFEGQKYYSEWVLVAIPAGVLIEAGCWDGENWYTSENAHPEKRITHWMPLPQPPVK